jgi:hypothetical protein
MAPQIQFKIDATMQTPIDVPALDSSAGIVHRAHERSCYEADMWRVVSARTFGDVVTDVRVAMQWFSFRCLLVSGPWPWV